MFNGDLASPRADGNFHFECGLMEFRISCFVRGKERLENNLTKLTSSYFRRLKEGMLGCLGAAQGTSSLDWILKGPRSCQAQGLGRECGRARGEQGQGLWAEVMWQTLAGGTGKAWLPGPLGRQLAGDMTCLCLGQLWSGLCLPTQGDLPTSCPFP